MFEFCRVPLNGQTKIVCVDKRVKIAGDCMKLTNGGKIFMGVLVSNGFLIPGES